LKSIRFWIGIAIGRGSRERKESERGKFEHVEPITLLCILASQGCFPAAHLVYCEARVNTGGDVRQLRIQKPSVFPGDEQSISFNNITTIPAILTY